MDYRTGNVGVRKGRVLVEIVELDLKEGNGGITQGE